MNSHEISLKVSEKEQEIVEACRNRDTVDLEIIHLRRQIDELRIKVRDLEGDSIKATAIVREKKAEHKALQDAFWNAKSSGI